MQNGHPGKLISNFLRTIDLINRTFQRPNWRDEKPPEDEKFQPVVRRSSDQIHYPVRIFPAGFFGEFRPRIFRHFPICIFQFSALNRRHEKGPWCVSVCVSGFVCMGIFFIRSCHTYERLFTRFCVIASSRFALCVARFSKEKRALYQSKEWAGCKKSYFFPSCDRKNCWPKSIQTTV